MAEVGRYYHNHNDNKGGYSEFTTVGSYLPNTWGLYDMHGNMYELCLDWFQYDLGTETAKDPKGAKSGTSHVFRGGGWGSSAYECRSSKRIPDPGIIFLDQGFRIALVQ